MLFDLSSLIKTGTFNAYIQVIFFMPFMHSLAPILAVRHLPRANEIPINCKVVKLRTDVRNQRVGGKRYEDSRELEDTIELDHRLEIRTISGRLGFLR